MPSVVQQTTNIARRSSQNRSDATTSVPEVEVTFTANSCLMGLDVAEAGAVVLVVALAGTVVGREAATVVAVVTA